MNYPFGLLQVLLVENSSCDLGGTRTHNLLLRRELLCPIELQGLEPTVGFEPTTHALQKHCSTTELSRQTRLQNGGRGGSRTRTSVSSQHFKCCVYAISPLGQIMSQIT